jgi:hypothetical protein
MKKSLFLILLALSLNSNAEVVSAENHGFEINIERVVKVDQKTAYEQFINVAEWWSSAHTFFGDSKNLTIEAKAGGCFCEKSEEKEVLHMTVSYVEPNKEIRMVGGLGPLQMLGVHGGMSWKFEAIDANTTKILHHYQVNGYMKGGFTGLAPIVDKVQTIQVESLVARLNMSSIKN